MNIIILDEALYQAAIQFGKINDLDIVIDSLQNIQVAKSELKLPNDQITVGNVPKNVITLQKEFVNTSQQPKLQTVTFEQNTENRFSTQTTLGFSNYRKTIYTVNTNIIVNFTQYDTKVSSSAKYNISNTKTYTTTQTVHWLKDVSLNIPPKTKTTIIYTIILGDFHESIPVWSTLVGKLVFGSATNLLNKYIVPLTYKGRDGQSIGDILGKLYNITTLADGEELLIEGSLLAQGSLAIQANIDIINTPLNGNLTPPSIQSLAVQPAARAVFF
ncbi:ETX/MTX2 family pore-forming toxin [Virgibacillus dokdonensis]|nr:ETX/MTX2 family pore-forming toxin [Virgibacillus dokdonensis]